MKHPDLPRQKSTAAATAADLLDRLPLARAALALFRYALDDSALASIFQRHRGRSYEDVVRFPALVCWLFDALADFGSGRQAHLARDHVAAPGCDTAFYGKLRRLPISLSVGFLQEVTARLGELFPAALAGTLPASLRPHEVLLIDGKALKKVAKRLAVTRGTPGRLLGGKLLVAYRPRDGQVIDMAVAADGEANEASLVGELAGRLRERPGKNTLFVADRQFSSLKVFRQLAGGSSDFIVRHAKTLSFTPDPTRPAKTSRGKDGRTITREWGWVSKKPEERMAVRRVSVTRVGEEPLAVLTDLTDEGAVPGEDVLAAYRIRWDIEATFSQVTTIFGLSRFVGSTAQATVFQAAMCFVLSNLQTVLMGLVAQERGCGLDDLSAWQIRQGWHRELIALKELTTPGELSEAIKMPRTAEQLSEDLRGWLEQAWHPAWEKTRNKKPRAHPVRAEGNGAHTSVVRRQQAARRDPSP